MSNFDFDFNDAGEQRSFDVIPDNTVCTVQMTIKPGGAGPDGWLTRAKDGNSEHLNCEFIVVDGAHAKRKFWNRYTVEGVNHATAIEISRKAFKAMLESACGVRPNDESDAAKVARTPQGWDDFDQLRFVVRLGIEPPKDGYDARNIIKEIITPERKEWTRPEQIDRSQLAKSGNGAAAAPASASTAQPAPANAIARPQWAE
jgi:hypothetical protein